MKKNTYRNFALISYLSGVGILAASQMTSCSCATNKTTELLINLNGESFQKANKEGVVAFNFTSNFNPVGGVFNFKLLKHDENAIELKQTSSTVIRNNRQKRWYNFAVVLQLKTTNALPVEFDLEISGSQGSEDLVVSKSFSLKTMRDVDPSVVDEPGALLREALFDDKNQIAEFTFNFVSVPDDGIVQFTLLDNDKLALVDDGVVSVDQSTLKGTLKVKPKSEINVGSEYLFNLQISFQVNGLTYKYDYQGFKCTYKIDKIDFISNNISTDIMNTSELVNYKFSFLHAPNDGKCEVTVTSEDNSIGFDDGKTTSIIAIDPENKLCEFALKVIKNIDLNDKDFVTIPFTLSFKFNSSIFNEEKIIDYPHQLSICLINADTMFIFNGDKVVSTNYDIGSIEYEGFTLNSQLSFDSIEKPIDVINYKVINGRQEYINQFLFKKLSNDTYGLIVSLNTDLIKQDKVKSFTFNIHTIYHAINKNQQKIENQDDFEGFEIQFADIIKPIPQDALNINGDSLIGIKEDANISDGYNTLVIPKNIIRIEKEAFKEKLPNNITNLFFEEESWLQEIKEGAFEGNAALTNELVLPESLYNIGQNAFKNCSGLSGKLVIPDRVVTLDTSAFESCRGLTSLKLGTTLIIGANCFKDCINLSGDLVIPKRTQFINGSAFENCASLSKLIFEKTAIIQSIGHKAFYNCRNITFVDQIPASLFWIGKNCFEGCVNLTHEIDGDVLVINKGLAIDECAFSGCNSIKAVSLMANSTIGNSAFTNCVNIEKLFISKDVNKYNWTEAFFNCFKLNEIDLSEFETVPGSWEFGSSSETFSNCASSGTIIVKNSGIGASLLEFMQLKGIGSNWTYKVK